MVESGEKIPSSHACLIQAHRARIADAERDGEVDKADRLRQSLGRLLDLSKRAGYRLPD